MPVQLSGNNIDTLAVSQVAITSSVTISGTSSASPTTCLTLPNVSYNGGRYLLIVSAINILKGTTNLDVEFKVDGTFQQSLSGHLAANLGPPAFLSGFFTLTPGNHAITVTAFVDAGSGTFTAGTGATGANPPAWAAVFPA